MYRLYKMFNAMAQKIANKEKDKLQRNKREESSSQPKQAPLAAPLRVAVAVQDQVKNFKVIVF